MRRSRFVPSFGGIIATIVVIFLWAPLLVVVLFSFHSATSLTLPFEGFSLRWYRELFNDTLFVKAAYDQLAEPAPSEAQNRTE